jgi:hypothetical protein
VVNANDFLNSVSVLLGNGTGGFGAATPFVTGEGPRTLAMGDVSGEGNLDLLVVNAVSNSVSVLLGNGAGSFASGVEYPTGFAPGAIALGNLDSDGDLDIATLNQGPNMSLSHFSVLLGNGTGGFGAPSNTPIGGFIRQLALGHVDSDGDLDMLVTVSGATGILFQGNGSGGFGGRTDWTMGSGPVEATIADLDQDGRPDLGAACFEGFSVLLGNGAGGFAPHREYPGGIEPRSLAMGDLDANGRADAVLVNAGSNSISVLLGRGKSETQLAAQPARCQLGAPLTLTATVGSLAPGGHVPTGSVRFFDGLTLLGSATVVGGVATLQLPAPYNSRRKLTAEYLGERRFYRSVSAPIAIEVFQTSVDVPAVAAEARFGLERVWPNPVAGGEGTVRFELANASPVRLGVFDVHGRRIFEHEIGVLEPGAHTLRLPGLEALASGLYFVRLAQGDRTAVARFTRLSVAPR